ncbi:GUN4 domain-containing protein [Sphaerospermopsis aphanizomenoides BCCUSP55]|nr:GUN4 domain-containing protein [Sphaerospermopsis aphanizomenoides BCCUSP55]
MGKMVAPFLDNNPRRLKQFINRLRLQTYMYYYSIGVKLEKEQITQYQLGKFMSITIQYPRLLYELQKDRELLTKLESCAIDKFNQSKGVNDSQNTETTGNNQMDTNHGNPHFWVNTYPKLAELLCYGKDDNDNSDDRISLKYEYSLKNEGIKKLLEVSPKLFELPAKYFKLREFLEEKKWREADEETLNVMLKVANREKQGYLTVEDIDNFPCHDLHIIDQLWVKYSEERFGFSVQKKIYQELGGTREYNEKIWQDFGDRVGWRKDGRWLMYDELTFTTEEGENAQRGHLPAKRLRRGSVSGWYLFFSRVETCKV